MKPLITHIGLWNKPIIWTMQTDRQTHTQCHDSDLCCSTSTWVWRPSLSISTSALSVLMLPSTTRSECWTLSQSHLASAGWSWSNRPPSCNNTTPTFISGAIYDHDITMWSLNTTERPLNITSTPQIQQHGATTRNIYSPSNMQMAAAPHFTS